MLKTKLNLSRTQRKSLGGNRAFQSLIAEKIETLTVTPDMVKQFPATEELFTKRVFENYLCGKISANTLSNYLTRWMNDPENFGEILNWHGGKDSPVANIISNIRDDIRGKLEGIVSSYASANDSWTEYQRIRADTVDRLGITRKKLDSMLGKVVQPKLFENLDTRKLDKAFGKGRMHFLICYFEKIAKEAINFSPGDIGDLLHLFYAEDCDVFRCDKRMASIMKDCHALKGSNLVGSLTDLPDAIDSFLCKHEQA